MIELIKAYGFVAVQQAFLLFYSLARTKVISSNLGTEGLGVFSQANTLLLLFFQLATFGTTVALNTSVAEYVSKGEKKKLPRLIFLVWGLNTLVGLVLLVGAGIFSEHLSLLAFGSINYSRYIFITALGGFTFIQVRFLVNVMRGLLEWQAYSLITSAGLLVGIGVVIYLVVSYGVDGAVFSLAAIQLINLICLLAFFLLRIRKKHDLSFKTIQFDRQMLLKILQIARPVMVILIIEPLSGFLIRSDIIRSVGIHSAGEYQVLAGLSMAYMNVIKEARLTYALPKASSMVEKKEGLIQMQNDNIRLGLFMILPLTVVLLAFRESIILLLYSPEFLAVANLLAWQFIGDILNVVRTNLNFVLVPLKQFKFYLFEGIAYWVGWVLFSVLLIRKIGLVAVPVGGAVAAGLSLILSLIFHSIRSGFKVNSVTRRSGLLLGTLGAVGYWLSLSLTPGWLRYGSVAVVLSGILLLIIQQGAHKLLFRYQKPG